MAQIGWDMGHFEGDWRSFPELVEWVESVKSWVADFEVYEAIPACGDGTPEDSDEIKLRALDAERLVWTEQTGNAPDSIVPGFNQGDWGSGGVLGWYLAKKAYQDSNLEIQTMKFMDCPACGNGELADSENCDYSGCEGEGELFLYLDDTDFRI